MNTQTNWEELEEAIEETMKDTYCEEYISQFNRHNHLFISIELNAEDFNDDQYTAINNLLIKIEFNDYRTDLEQSKMKELF